MKGRRSGSTLKATKKKAKPESGATPEDALPAPGTACLATFHPLVQEWFNAVFEAPTLAQSIGWPAIRSGASTLILAPTGSGKTLTAFLSAIDQLLFSPTPPRREQCRVLYISPLKALAVDVERNLRAPLAGISALARQRGLEPYVPTVAIRTGDTPQRDRARFLRQPSDILITTPESLYLLLTSNAREALRSIQTVIIDEIHALVPTKRGAHLALSLERLDRLCPTPPQRIGLSATQRPLDEVARFLGGASATLNPPASEEARSKMQLSESSAEAGIEAQFTTASEALSFRPVTIVDTGERKRLSLSVQVPVEDMSDLGDEKGPAGGSAAFGPTRHSIWPALHPRLLDLIRQHRSTLIFVNNRRLAERLAGALNELAGETLVRAHHGSIAREQRVEIEDALKSGQLPALVATSSLELGIDMGAIDLVVQIEAPPSIASGMQRIGRASHQAGSVSNGVLIPKYRGDLLACAAVSDAMKRGAIEATRYPRNPLDVLAQQVVAMVSIDDWRVDDLYQMVRGAAPFAELSESIFEGVLDMLSGVYPADEFAELRPRINWDRIGGLLSARGGSRRVAVINGGTIPDRGLFGVFLVGAERGGRVGELDEEMVFESRAGETFVLGASTWRIEEITNDRVMVSPAPGEPGKMPFWHGDTGSRSSELGLEIGKLVREIGENREKAAGKLERQCSLDEMASQNLMDYVDEQKKATGSVPDDRTILIERCIDELGDWRVCVLSPFGGRVHAPWAMAATAKIREELGTEVETMWGDDGFVIRFPASDEPPPPTLFLPPVEEIEHLVIRQLGGSSLFAARFRENAARALLLPRRFAGKRTSLWQQRKRSADLLSVASRFGSFPILLETYRECLVDVFDMPGLLDAMRRVETRGCHIAIADTETPSPFAASLLFRYVANYIYDGDAPLAERRAQALAIDQAQLRELLGQAEFRELLDAGVIESVERRLQRLDAPYHARSADSVHDLLLGLGDLSRPEISARTVSPEVAAEIDRLVLERRALNVTIGGERRFIAVEDAARYRDALGIPLPPGIAERLLRPVSDPLGDLVSRFSRTHAPFTLAQIAARLRTGPSVIEAVLQLLVERGRLVEGEFTPGGTHREWCDADVLRSIRRGSLARLRHEIEPVEPRQYARLLSSWQGLSRRKSGVDGLLDVIETLQGFPIAASLLEAETLPARIENYRASDLDMLAASGEIVWTGVESHGDRDGRIALYLASRAPLLMTPRSIEVTGVEQRIVDVLRSRGALFFQQIHQMIGGGFENDTLVAIWDLVWKGALTNDTFHALRSFVRPKRGRVRAAAIRSRKTQSLPSSEGRWSLVPGAEGVSSTDRAAAIAQQLLDRYGIVSREAAALENLAGGFSGIYDVLKALEERGRVRRGYFVAGISATQFATPSAIDLLRSFRQEEERPEALLLAATDPANPYGGLLRWPESRRPLARAVGARVVLIDGRLAAWLGRSGDLETFLPEDEPLRSLMGKELARILAGQVASGAAAALLYREIDGVAAEKSVLAPFLAAEGFVKTAAGLQLRRRREGAVVHA